MTTPQKFGAKGDGLTDDSVALNAWAAAGGGEIPEGNFILNGPLHFPRGFRITRWQGRILYRRGWLSGYALSPRDWSQKTYDLLIDASAGGSITLDGDSDMPRKGFGLINLDRFTLIGTHYQARPATRRNENLFAYEWRDSYNGTLIRCGGDNRTTKPGSDLFHWSRSNRRHRLIDCYGYAHDDTLSSTIENPEWGKCVMKDIHVLGGEFTTDGYSAVKALISTDTGSSIEDFVVENAILRVKKVGTNPGQPVIIQPGKGAIRNVATLGCEFLAA